MVRKFWNNLDKTARGNCVCLFIAMTILCAIAFKNQNACRITDTQAVNSLRGFMVKHMFPCDASGRTPFRAPSELSGLLGADVPAPRNMGTLPPGARYKLEQQRKQQQQY